MSVIEFKNKEQNPLGPESSFSFHKRISDLGVDFAEDKNEGLTFRANYGTCTFGWVDGFDVVVGDLEGVRFQIPITGELIQEFGLTAEAAIATVSCFCERMARNQAFMSD